MTRAEVRSALFPPIPPALGALLGARPARIAPIPRTEPLGAIRRIWRKVMREGDTIPNLPTAPDILTAARQRLRDWTDEQITLARASVDAALRSQDSLQDIFEASDIPVDGRNPFSAFCALLAVLAHEERDMELFWQAGYQVMDWQRQTERARSQAREPDALDRLILLHLQETPGIRPVDLWRDFCDQADRDHDVLIEADPDEGWIDCAVRDGTTRINYDAFRRRVQRLRKVEPAAVTRLPLPVTVPAGQPAWLMGVPGRG